MVILLYIFINYKILQALGSGLLGILVFIECQKVFDKVGRTKSTQKFKAVAFPGHFVNWL